MQAIPLQAVPVQTVNTVVEGQNCQIYLKQTTKGFFFDLNVNGTDLVDAVFCQNCNPLVCIQYTGFQGNFIFVDTQGIDDPPAAIYGQNTAVGIGVRWQLVYLDEAENMTAAETNVYFE